jgi:hypothetical protein
MPTGLRFCSSGFFKTSKGSHLQLFPTISKSLGYQYRSINMATPTTIKLSTAHKPEFYSSKMSDAAAERVSELLQENHEKHHIFVNKSRFHVI